MAETTFVTLETIACCSCGIVFGVPQAYEQKRREKHDTFYCPNGHSLHFPGKTEAEQLRDKLAAARAREDQLSARLADQMDATEHERRRAMGFKGALTKTNKRVGNGVCPCCSRSFQNLQRHMASQHPGYSGEPTT